VKVARARTRDAVASFITESLDDGEANSLSALVHYARAAAFAALAHTAAWRLAGGRGAPTSEHRSHDEEFVLAARHAEASARGVEHQFQATQVTSIDRLVPRR